MIKTLLMFALLFGFTSPSPTGDFTLKISKIEMKKTPQSGDWRAGVTLYQEAEKDNRDSWHGGENKYAGADASLPVNLEISGLNSGEVVTLFIGLDDDAEDAGGDKAEDKLEIKFKVFSSGSKEKVYAHAQGDWSVRIHYILTK